MKNTYYDLTSGIHQQKYINQPQNNPEVEFFIKVRYIGQFVRQNIHVERESGD
jgi:hypothetical protein